jgi:hypothetical protein
MKSWQLRDASQTAASYPYTFFKSPPEAISKVAPGERVKLIFQFESHDSEAPGAERMWVVVDETTSDGHFVGRLDNTPRHIIDLKLNDPVQFRACHIINTEHDDPDNLIERYIKRCFVTNRILQDGQRVGYLYREEPDNEKDSGWRLTANDESVEYMDDAKNSQFVSLGAVLNLDDSFITLLDSPAGSAFVLDTLSGEFVPVDR